MKQLFALLLCALLTACAAPQKQAQAPVVPVEVAPVLQPAADPYARLATAMLKGGRQAAGEKANFLSYVEEPVAANFVAMGVKGYVSPEQATKIADFFESPAGQGGMSTFRSWLLTGKFMKEPLPADMGAGWQTFQKTAEGVKLLSNVTGIFKSVAVPAVKVGGPLVIKALTGDIGKTGAMEIVAAAIKSGASFR
jgi:hypothetical protein